MTFYIFLNFGFISFTGLFATGLFVTTLFVMVLIGYRGSQMNAALA